VNPRAFLILGAAFILLAWAASAGGLMRQVPAFLRLLVAALFVLSAVRIGLSIAIIAFDKSTISYLIPISFALLAWWLRPGRAPRP
jgi:hypothetical protein